MNITVTRKGVGVTLAILLLVGVAAVSVLAVTKAAHLSTEVRQLQDRAATSSHEILLLNSALAQTKKTDYEKVLTELTAVQKSATTMQHKLGIYGTCIPELQDELNRLQVDVTGNGFGTFYVYNNSTVSRYCQSFFYPTSSNSNGP